MIGDDELTQDLSINTYEDAIAALVEFTKNNGRGAQMSRVKTEITKLLDFDPTLASLVVLARRISIESSGRPAEIDGFTGDENEVADKLLAIRMAISRNEYDKAWRMVYDF